MKNQTISLVMSAFMPGLGIIYLGDLMRGIGLMLSWLIIVLMFVHSSGLLAFIIFMITVTVWSYALCKTFSMSND